jgi:hypothetical protein
MMTDEYSRQNKLINHKSKAYKRRTVSQKETNEKTT